MRYFLLATSLVWGLAGSGGVRAAAQDSLRAGLSDQARVDSLNQLAAASHSDPGRSLRWANEAFGAATTLNYRAGVRDALRHLAGAYQTQGDHAKALENFLSSLPLGEGETDSTRAGVLSSVGNAYLGMGNYRLAQQYLQQGLTLFRRVNNPPGVGLSYQRLGYLQQRLGNHARAMQYYQQALRVARALSNQAQQASVLICIGSVQQEEGEYERALEHYDQALAIQARGGDSLRLAATLLSVGNIHAALANYPQALSYYQRAITTAQQFGLLDVAEATHQRRAELYAHLGQPARAYQELRKRAKIQNDLFDEQKLETLAQMQLSLSAANQQKTIEVLREQQKVQAVQLEKKQAAIGFWGAGAVLGALLVFGGLIAYRIIQRDNALLLERNAEITEQKEEIEAQSFALLQNNRQLEAAQATIEQRSEALRQANNALEDRVEDRTRQLTQAFVELLKVNQNLDTLIYRASHDLKGPLATLIGVCNIAQIDVRDPLALDYFGKIEATARNMDRLLLQILDISNVREGKLLKNPINFEDLTRQTLANLLANGDQRAPLVQISIQPGLYFRSDERLLRIIMQTLLENAIHYSTHYIRQQARVQVQVGEGPGRNVFIRVADNGLGINDETASRVFDMFYRGREAAQGAGLGLYIAKIAAEKLNGTIELKNRDRGETVLEVMLPR